MTRVFYRWLSKWLGEGGQPLLTRRTLVASALAFGLKAQKPAPLRPVPPLRPAEISSFDLSLLDEGPTPIDLFFVREHFPAPTLSSAGWKLEVSGAVATPLALPFDELIARPQKTLPVTMECAENPIAGGLVSHAEWSGVSLGELLAKAQPVAEARFVRLAGADGFSRAIPLEKAMHPDTLIANNMNGEKLPVNHGFPLRAVIPGWYGMDSVKWLRSVEVLTGDIPAQGYLRQVRSLLAGSRAAGPVTAMNVKAAFSRPLDGAILTGRRFVVRGAAWAGENRVRQVEVSVDGGKSWRAARLASDAKPYTWVHWSHAWTIEGAGSYELVVRATDDKGRRQPAERVSERIDDYEWNASQRVRVTVT